MGVLKPPDIVIRGKQITPEIFELSRRCKHRSLGRMGLKCMCGYEAGAYYKLLMHLAEDGIAEDHTMQLWLDGEL